MAATHIRATVVLPRSAPALADARITVTVEDVSELDQPAVVLGRAEVDGVSRGPGGGRLEPVLIEADLPDPRRSYTVRVHIDANRTGDVTRGDLISTSHHPVAPGDVTEFDVPVHLIPL